MPVLKNPQHEAFATRRAAAKFNQEPMSESVLAIWGNPKARTLGQMKAFGIATANKSQVKVRIQELVHNSVRLDGPETMTLPEAKKFLIKVIIAKPDEAGPSNPLCEMKMGKMGPYFVFPDKAKCMETLAKLNGWTADVSVSVRIPSFSSQDDEPITDPVLLARDVTPPPTICIENGSNEGPTNRDILLPDEREGVVDGLMDEGVQLLGAD